MNTKKIIDDFPEVYKNFLPDFLNNTIPEETLATCHDCAMCKKEGDPEVGMYFSPNLKCCTYHPNLPNYLIGGLLTDKSPEMDEGRRRIREKIKKKIAVTPYGIDAPKKYRLLSKNQRSTAFGNNKLHICPYYEKSSGNCTIWKFREATCSTWFCKYVAGTTGKKFWLITKEYFKDIQSNLIEYVMYKMGWDSEIILNSRKKENEVEELSAEDLDDLSPSNNVYQSIWGEWSGREEEFYKETFRIIETITPEQFEQISGFSQYIHLDKLKKIHQQVVNPSLPEKLQRNPQLLFTRMESEFCQARIPSLNLSVEIPRLLYDILDLFDGLRTNEEVLQLVLEQKNTEIEENLLLGLYRNAILIDRQN